MILTAMATGHGLRNKIKEKMATLNGHIQIFNYDANHSEVSVTPISLEQNFYPNWQKTFDFSEIYQQQSLWKKISAPTPKVTHIQPIITKGGIIRTAKTFEGIIAKGVDKNYQWQQMQSFVTQGNIPDFSTENPSNEVLISQYLANRLELKVGDICQTLFLKDDGNALPNQRNFTIAGIYNSGFEQFDATYILLDMRHLQKINKWEPNQIGFFEVFINDFEDIQPIGEKIYEQIASDLDAQTLVNKYRTIFEWFHTFDLNIAIIIGIMILVGGMNMITALLVLILERTPMIGSLKALGCNNWSVRKIFIYNAGYLIGLGLFWGNVIGLGLLLIQKYFGVIKLNPSVYYVSQVPIELSLWSVLSLNAGIMICCLVMMILPTYVVTKISPIKAIKFD